MIDDYLVDVPVKINIWIRPELQKKQFEVIKKAKPSILFIQSDGGRNEAEWAAIRQNRQMIDNGITWNCKVYRIYEEENKGLYHMGAKVNNFIWSKVDRFVGLEDDCIPSVSFFRFCKELLDKYENDERIMGICGYNPLGVYEDVSSDYFFSGETSSWSFATWKRAWLLLYSDNFDYINEPHVLKLMRLSLGKYTYSRAIKGAKDKQIDGHPIGSEFLKGISRATQNALFITPKRNMISNVGCGLDSAHSFQYNTLTSAERKLFNSPVYEVGTINHPRYVIRDVLYEKELRKLLAIGMPLRKFYRRCGKFILIARYMGLKGLSIKFKKLAANRHET